MTALLMVMVIVGGAWGAVVEFGEVRVSTLPVDGVRRTFHGYLEHRLVVENGSDREHRVTVAGPADRYGRGNRIDDLRRRVVVGPGSRVVMSLMQPPVSLGGSSQVKIWIDGREQEQWLELGYREHGLTEAGPGGVGGHPCILLSRGVQGDFQSRAEAALVQGQTRRHYSSQKALEAGRSELGVGQWSGEWLGYTRFDAVVVSGGEWEAMPGPVREALERYAECGGLLVVCGAEGLGGLGDEAWSGQGMRVWHRGFGEVVSVEAEDVGGWSPETWRSLKAAWDETHMPWRLVKTRDEANRQFPVEEDMGVPLRGMFVVILAFALLIGPLNVLFFSKKGRRMRLLWTVPLISVLTSGAILAFSLISEGVESKYRVASLTVLDEGARRASTVGLMGFYSPLTPGGGLRFGYETEVTGQLVTNWSDNESNRLRVDWTNGQHLTSGWVNARVPTHFMVRKSELRRERLIVREEGGRVVVTNGLGGKVERLVVADGEGRLYFGSGIEAGAEAALTAIGENCRRGGGSLRELYKQSWQLSIHTLMENTANYLRPGCYVAVLEGSVFLEEALGNVGERKELAVVYGIGEGGE